MRGLVAWMIVAVVMAASFVARGQEVSNEAGPMAMIVPRRSIEVYAGLLGLSAEQKEQAALLHDGYKAAYAAIRKTGDEAMRKLRGDRDGNPPPTRTDQHTIVMDYVAKAEALEKTLFDDLKAILTPEQSARFERVVRARHRETGLRFSFAAGAGVDLLAVADAAKVERTGPVAEALDRYETDLDRVLIERMNVLRGIFKRAKEMEDARDDPKVMQELIADLFNAAFRVRDVNRRAVREIAPLLPDDTRTAFEAEFRLRAFPKVYAPGPAAATLTYAKDKGRLSPEKLEELERLWQTYTRDAATANARLVTAIEAREVEYTTRFLELMAHQGDPEDKSELRDAWKTRRDLDANFVTRAIELIGKEAAADLPQPEYLSFRDVAEPDFDEDEKLKEADEEQ